VAACSAGYQPGNSGQGDRTVTIHDLSLGCIAHSPTSGCTLLRWVGSKERAARSTCMHSSCVGQITSTYSAARQHSSRPAVGCLVTAARALPCGADAQLMRAADHQHLHSSRAPNQPSAGFVMPCKHRSLMLHAQFLRGTDHQHLQRSRAPNQSSAGFVTQCGHSNAVLPSSCVQQTTSICTAARQQASC
jgi:hypothetical protein